MKNSLVFQIDDEPILEIDIPLLSFSFIALMLWPNKQKQDIDQPNSKPCTDMIALPKKFENVATILTNINCTINLSKAKPIVDGLE